MPGFYDVFSKRNQPLPDVFRYDELPHKLRVQLVKILEETLFKDGYDYLRAVQHIVCEEHGRFCLRFDGSVKVENAVTDIADCILETEDTNLVLDVIDRSMASLRGFADEHQAEEFFLKAVAKLNHRFLENGIGYQFNIDINQLIRIDSTLLHQSNILPVLSLLADSHFASANGEFIQAFDDYKSGDWSDCVVKSCAAYESVLKIVCDDNGWPYDPKDTCSNLVLTVQSHGNIESFLAEPLKTIGMIRNKKSVAHGGGTVVRDVNEALARYCLNTTAASILYVVESSR